MVFAQFFLCRYMQSRVGKIARSCQLRQPITGQDLIHLARSQSQPYNKREKFLRISQLIRACVISATTQAIADSNPNFTGLEKYLNSTLPVGQLILKFCLPRALPPLPKFSNKLIIHEPKNGSQSTVQECYKFNVINPS